MVESDRKPISSCRADGGCDRLTHCGVDNPDGASEYVGKSKLGACLGRDGDGGSLGQSGFWCQIPDTYTFLATPREIRMIALGIC